MGLASIPFLVSIFYGIQAILRSIWQAAVQRAQTIAVWFGILVPWILKWLINLRGWKLVVIGALFVVVAATVRVAIQAVFSVWQITDRLGWAFIQFDFVGWFIWDGPLQLKVAWSRFWDITSAYFSFVLIKMALSRLVWWRDIAGQLVRPS